MPSTARRPSAPPTLSHRRTVFAFLAATSARPVEGEDADDLGARPPVHLLRSALSTEWAEVSDLLAVRRALGHSDRGRTLGRSGFVDTVRAIAADCRTLAQQGRAFALAEIEDERGALHEAHRRAVADLYEAAEESRRPVDFSAERALVVRLRDDLADLDEDAPRLLLDHERDASSAVQHLTPRGVDVVRLRRDLDGLAWETWEVLADYYAADDPDAAPFDWEALLQHAEALGFDTTSPLPASSVHRVETWPDEDEDDEEPDYLAPVVPIRRAKPADVAEDLDDEPAPLPRPTPEARTRSRALKAAHLAQHGPGKPCAECGRAVVTFPTEDDCTSDCVWP